MDIQVLQKLLFYISSFLALLIVLPMHEFAHAFAAVKSGDITPKLYGRYTLNPFAHFDIFGVICFIFAGFGWAKPVPVNPNNFRNYKKGSFLVSIAGVTANYILAFVAFPLYVLTLKYVPDFGYFTVVLQTTLRLIFSYSLIFFIFNLIPVYPLDGFRVIDVFCKKTNKVYWFLRNYGVYFLYALIILSILADYTGLSVLNFFGRFMTRAGNVIGYPITWFWGLIL